MRNILAYPITEEEMLNAIDRAISEVDLSTMGIGDIHLSALHAVRDRLCESFENPSAI